ncbi:MAG: hypothetical protein K2X93_01035 [Candidatus Obscuribacterales bacterium]|nr:hypothetical protein [Candidatus Obscuribacterales bacterium]
MQNRWWKLLFFATAASAVASCTDAQSQPAADKSKGKTKIVKTVIAGQDIAIDDGIALSADERTPLLLFKSSNSTEIPPTLEVSKETTVWNNGRTTRFQLLGLRNDVESHSRAYAVSIETFPSPTPKFSNTASGSYSWSYNNSTSLHDGTTFKVISTNPLLVIGSDSGLGSSNDYTVVTNFGIRAVKGKALNPKAIRFKKNSGEEILCPWKESISYYDIPESAKGHGTIRGPAPGTSTCATSIGPAKIVLSRTYPGKGLTDVSLNVAPGALYHGPFILSYTVPDFYSASIGIPTYIPPGSQPPMKYVRHAAHDADFRETWALELNPPIMVEYGMGADGPATGAARISFQIWKFGDKLYGSGGYSYSDCGLRGGGWLEGEINDGVVSIKMTGQPNMTLISTLVTRDEIRGTAKILGDAPGFGPQSSSSSRTFVLKASNSGDDGTFTRSSSESNSKGRFSDLERKGANKDYWDALTTAPGTYGRNSLALETERLIQAESVPSSSKYSLDGKLRSLAHMQYCAWLSHKSKLGLNHPITVANGKVAEVLFQRVLSSSVEPVSTDDTTRKHLSEILRASNRAK